MQDLSLNSMGQEETVTPRAAGERNENYDVEALDEII
jgi:hypothetical protein